MQLDTRKMMACLAGVLLVGALASLTYAQTRPAPGGPGKPGSPPKSAPPIKTEVKTDKKQYGVNDPIKMTFIVTNTTQTTLPIRFSSGQRYEFEIKQGKDTTGASLWKWSQGRMFAQMILNSKLEPGKPLNFTEEYKPGAKSARGDPLPALTEGTYTVVATLTTMGNAPRPQATVSFTLK